MLAKVLDHFQRIAATPHCSFETGSMKTLILEFAIKCGFEVEEDNAGNIVCRKGNPSICLQSHYDMVCMGEAPHIELIEKEGWLHAKNSSLGSDNGMGMAIMMAMMETNEHLECLFTNDEEVGLIGANNLTLQLKASKLLNLDSEDEHGVFIGCAGGVDIFGRTSLSWLPLSKESRVFELRVKDLPGGHSGVDIAKNIPNALKVLANILASNDCCLIEFEGGERNNSIPKSARAVIAVPHEFTCDDSRITVKEIEGGYRNYMAESGKIIHMIHAFAQGVRVFNTTLNIPETSINLSTLRQYDGYIEVEFFARAMQQEGIEQMKSEMNSLLQGFGFEVRYTNECAPWQPVEGAFAQQVVHHASKVWDTVSFKAIHAGLECGVIAEKQKKPMEVCSIGPTIEFPHSVRERCDLASVERVVRIVDLVLQEG